MTKLNSTLPKGERKNGLDAVARRLIDEPHQRLVVIATIDCKSITTDTDSGEIEPTARVCHIEAITDDAERNVADAMLHRAQDRRTGRPMLPFALEENLRAALANTDDSPDD